MVRIVWTHLAKDDLRSIYLFIAKDSRLYAKRQIIKLKSRTAILKEYPKLGSVVPEFEIETIRQLVEGNYRIIYKIISPTYILILTVHHSARDLENRREDMF